MKKFRVFYLNILIIITASLVIQSISITFNAYISKIIGSEALGLYHQVMSVYAFCVTVATSGISVAVTKKIAEKQALNNKNAAKSILIKSVFLASLYGFSVFIALFIFSKEIAVYILKDYRASNSLKILAFSIPVVALTSVINGYLTAVKNMAKTCGFQIVELLIKITIIFCLFNIYKINSIETGCFVVVLGNVSGEVITFVFLIYTISRKSLFNTNFSKKATKISEILNISLPIAISSYVRSALNTYKQILIPKGLLKSGLSKGNALINYGTINGMAMPVISFPMNILYQSANLIIPEITDALINNNNAKVKRIVFKAFKTTLAFTLIIFTICFFYGEKIGYLIYENKNAGKFLAVLSPIMITMYIDAVADGILKGLNQQMYSMKYNIIDSVISVILIYLIIPMYGISGYIFVIYVSEVFNTALSVRRVFKVLYN